MEKKVGEDSGAYCFRCQSFVIPVNHRDVMEWPSRYSSLMSYAADDQDRESSVRFQVAFNLMGAVAISCEPRNA